MTPMPLQVILDEQLLNAGYSEKYDGYARISSVPGQPGAAAITFTRKIDGLGPLRLPVGREFSETEIVVTDHCARCRCRHDPPLPAEETLVDRDARIRLLDSHHLGTGSVLRLVDDTTVIEGAPGWFTERFPDPLEEDADVVAATAGPNTGVITIAHGRITPARITTVRDRHTVDAGRIDNGLVIVVAAAMAWGAISALMDTGFLVWLGWLIFQSIVLTLIFTPPRQPKHEPFKSLWGPPAPALNTAPTDQELTAGIAKVHGRAYITATVLKNGKLISERRIEQAFNGETHLYQLVLGKELASGSSSNRYELSLKTHVLAEPIRRTPPTGAGQPPFLGGTREGS